MATFQIAIDNARLSLNDKLKVRYPDAACLVFGADGVRETAILRPDLFTITQAIACIPGQLVQTVDTAVPRGLYVIDVQGVVGGKAVHKADFDTMRRFNPNFRNDAAGPAENWFPITDDQTKKPQPTYYIYPKAPSGQQLITQYVYDPLDGVTVTLSTPIPLADQLIPAIESYVIFRAEMGDDEHAVSGRAQAAYSNFMQLLGVAEKSRKMIVQEGRPQ
jgi:hypothetical protein